MAWGCPKPAENAGVDWSNVQTQSVRIRHYEYEPMVVFLRQHKPAILRFYNADDVYHDVWSPELFRALEIHEVQIGDAAPRTGCFFGVHVPARQMVTLKVIPRRDGRYPIHDAMLPVLPMETPEGIIHVEAPPMDWGQE